MLEVRDLHTYFGKSHILQGVSLDIGEGEAVTILGRNGAGKTTTLRSIMAIARDRTGEIRWKGRDLVSLRTDQITRLGVAYVPEDRRIFSQLTVEENLEIAAAPRSRWGLDDAYALFPALAQRRSLKGQNLSGGEQQMLAIGRALMTGPELLLLDEPSQGLAPIVLDALYESLLKIRREGMSILLVEQALDVAMRLADRDYIMEHGQVVYEGSAIDFKTNREVRERYLRV